MIHKIISEPIFLSETLFYVCKDVDKVISHVKTNYDIQLDKREFVNATGLCCKLDNMIPAKHKGVCWFVWMESPGCLRLTIHEGGHLVFSILKHHGIRCNYNDQEAYCYFAEFFISELWKAMELPKKK